ncbi:virion RNA polymerase [Escherichia phage OLB145]|uniref:Virion RNA polymerase n=1 Tax=Escherichia phage OLB145 TaxID=2448910 RepID=A0A3G3MDF1_9CAUD|nr:virion RNA polymerase [Escherichia phage OLB145]
MSVFDRLAGFADSVTNAKQVDVSTATAQKKAEQGVTTPLVSPDAAYQMQAARTGNVGANAFEPGTVQSDFMNLTPMQIMNKYGVEQGLQLINARADAGNQVFNDSVTTRTPGEELGDIATGVGLGFVNTLGGIGALGAGLLNDDAGAVVAQQLSKFNDAVHATQSQALQDKRKLFAARNLMNEVESERQYQTDKKEGTNDIVASLSKFGRDFVGSIENAAQTDSIISDGLAEGVGSLLGAGPVLRGASLLGKAVVPANTLRSAALAGAIDAGTGTQSLARIASTVGRAAPGMVGVGAIEAGGAYQQTADEIMKMSLKDLEKSPVYQQHIKDGMSPEQARRQTASETGLTAAAIQLPIAAATGPLVFRFEMAPFRAGSLGAVGMNLARETVEEGVQGATGQLAQNIAQQQNIDKNQDLLKGVGTQAGLGALYGFGSAGVVQAPAGAARLAGAATAPVLRTTMAGVKAAGSVAGKVVSPIKNTLVARGERVMKQNEEASPVADDYVAQAAQEAMAQAPEAEVTIRDAVEATDATPEQKVAAHQYVSDLMNATRFNPENYQEAPEHIRNAVAGSTDQVQVIQKLADLVNTLDESNPQALMEAASYMYDAVSEFEQFINRDPAALDSIPKDSPAIELLNRYTNLTANIQNTPKVIGALNVINRMINESAQNGSLDVTEESSPQEMQNVALAAEVAPEKLNPESVNVVLKHAADGRIKLNNRQIAALQNAAAILKGAREYDAEAARLGLRPQDIVSKQIKTDESRTQEGQYSALQHANRIRSAYNSGNFELASAYLNDFMQFAQHMQNKVGALNEHLVTGNADKNKSVHYQALTADREWVRSRTGLGVNPYDTKSVKFAQQVALEAKTVADIANALASAYPELKVSHIKVTPLDSRLNAPAAEVVKAFRQGNRDVASSQQKADSVNQVKETPVTKQEPVTSTVQTKTPVSEPVKTEPTTKESRPQAIKEPVSQSEKQDATLTNEDTIEQPTESVKETETSVKERTVTEELREGIDAVYPSLVGTADSKAEGIKNYFKLSFTLPEEQKSRTVGSEAPLKDVAQALSSRARYELFTEKEVANPAFNGEVIKRYKELMEHGEGIADILRSRLAKFLNTKDVGKRFAQGTEANRWVGGKLLNIVEQDGDTFKYNEQLLQTAVLAGLQWRLTATSNTAIKDAKDVAAITGIDQALLPEGLVEQFDTGMTLTEAVSSLAQKIESYWGLSRNPNAPLGYTKGIPTAMAAEILAAFVESTDVVENIVDMSEIDPDNKKTIGLYTITELDSFDPINSFPTAIEEAVLVNPTEKMFFGNDIPPVANTQLRNPAVRNTPEQKAALKAEQTTEFYVHTPMVQFYETLGKDRILELMGAGTLNKELLNDNHAKSLEGKNRSVEDSYNQLFSVIEQVRAQSEDISTVPIHYAYNMTRVGRMQMLGKYNPQSAKLVREAILPTKATLDLSNQNNEDFSAFQLGLAQALDIKVHTMTREVMSDELTKLLEGNLKPAIDMMVEFNTTGSLPENAVDVLNTALGDRKSFVALMALMEYSRYLVAEDKSAFVTPLYVEADGVTNGPINAMMLMTGGLFTPDWIRNIAKGGLFIGSPNKTMNEHRSTADNNDLYQASTNALMESLGKLRSNYASNMPIQSQIDSLLSLMDLFLPDINLGENGALELKRGIAKNPLTITIYGSGARGIAGKLVSSVTDAIYERMSDVLKARAKDPNISAAMAMFGKQAASEAHAEELLARFLKDMETLTSTVPVKRKGVLELQSTGAGAKGKINPKTYTIKGEQLKALQENMLHFFVEPLRNGITQTVGESLVYSTEQLQKATQIQSVVLEDMFKQRVQEKLTEKAKDPTWKKGDFLTQKELNDIQASLNNLAPMIETGSQTFYIAGSENAEVANQVLATNLDDRMRVPMSIYAPAQAGVAGIPFMTIGTGDGMMMQTLSTMKGAPKNTLKIFDGMNIGLNDITDASRKANEAVYTSWQGNPIKNVYESYAKFMKNVDFSKLSPEALEAIGKSALEYDQRENATVDDIANAASLIERNLRNIALGVDIRHKVLDKVNLSIDQMAAVGAPYQNNGKIDLSNMTPEQQADELNKLFREELEARKQKVAKAKAEVKEETVSEKEPVNPDFGMVGREHKASGVRILSATAIRNLAKISNLPSTQAATLAEIQKSLAAKDYKIIYGTPTQVAEYARQKNVTELTSQEMEEAQAGNIYGWTNFDDKTIYLVSPSMETLIHELVHASTFEEVYSFYQGNEVSPTSKQAIENLEGLMEQFRSLDISKDSPEMREAYADAIATIEGHLSNGFVDPAISKAAALNEFMAWGLANRALTDKQKRTSSLVQMVKDVYQAIKKLIWGRKQAPALGEDMFSNLLFNSAILMRSQPTTQAVAKDGTLFHSKAYGNNERLSQLNQTFDKLVTDYLRTDPVTEVERRGNVANALMSATRLVRDVQSRGFNMTAQEQSVFQMVTAALATEAAIDPHAMARAQELYTHVMKHLTVEHFMTDPDSTNPADRYYAQQKYDTISGANLVEVDAKGRTSLLPTFLGLAMVNEELRSIIKEMPVPKADKKLGNDVDTLLTNAGTQVMESLNRRMAGDQKATNVQDSIDALSETIMTAALKRESFYDAVATPTGNFIDRANQYVTDSIERLSETVIEKADKVIANPSNVAAKGVAHLAKLTAAIASEKQGEIVAQGVMTAMNQGKVWQPFHDLVNDIVGRTKTNANVYDLIKLVKSQISQDRQQFREHLPTVIAGKFSRKLTDTEWSAMHTGLGKTDLAVLRETMSMAEIRDLLSSPKKVKDEISTLEKEIQNQAGRNWNLVQKKSKQLAQYMITGEVGNNLLRNAHAISRLLGERITNGPVADVAAIDKLITLYSLELMNKSDRDLLSELAQSEVEGMEFSIAYMVGQRTEEMRKAKGDNRTLLNHFKGYIPVENQQGVNLIIADDKEFAKLNSQSFTRIGTYQGSTGFRTGSKGYYFSPVAARAPYSQGILQNVRNTAGGVDIGTGFTLGTMVAGRITDKPTVERITKALAKGERGREPLMPIYNSKGQVVAYEQSIDPNMLKHLNQDNHFAKMVGVWRGRQVEEAKAQRFNDILIEQLHAMYEKDIKDSSANKSQYVNLLGKIDDPVLADAINLMNIETRHKAEELFGKDELWVRRDMLNDALGYRAASIGDVWTGNSRWSPSTLDTVKKMFLGAFGNKAYHVVMNAENTIQNLVKDAKTVIVVKSVVVPAVNFLANIYQMIGRGVPVKDIAVNIPRKTSEINQYIKSRLRQIDAEAELRAAEGNPNLVRKLKTEIQSITDSHRRMSIWPLIEAGEFSSIADAGISRDDLLVAEGKIHEYMEKLANKLPEKVRNAGRYALIAKDTALFQGIQKTVEYSDFIAKAIIYDDLVKRKKKSSSEALGQVTEEFVNYDRLPGRFRGYMESMGLMWFYNFKIRSIKVAMSMIRNNPVHSLIATVVPAPAMFGNVGLPIQDNMLTMLAEGRLDYSLGFGQGLRAPTLNPWFNLTH